MWLRRLVGLVLIITLVGMNTVLVMGIVIPEKKKPIPVEPAVVAVVPVPTLTLTASPTQIPAQTTAAISWTTTGNPTDCTASGGSNGSWSGAKTPFGAESTGRINDPGNYTFTLTCKNSGGSVTSAATVTVGNAVAPKQSVVTTSKSTGGGTATYCGGRAPCYGKKDVAAHGSAGSCWGYNIDRVINITSFDSAYHQTKSGISSIEVSAVCGKDLAPSLNGEVTVEGPPRNHNQTTKTNADSNMKPYFIGYFDPNK